MENIQKLIEKLSITYSEIDARGNKGEYLYIAKNKKPTTAEIALVKENKPEIIAILKTKIEQDKIEKQAAAELERAEETQKYIENNEPMTIGLMFYMGTSIWGLPGILKDKQEMLLKAEKLHLIDFPLSAATDGFDSIQITYSQICEIEKKVMAIETEKQTKKDAAEKAHYDAKLTEAIKKNDRVVFNSFSVDCDDKHEECNTDIITVYLYPDGTKKSEKCHTW